MKRTCWRTTAAAIAILLLSHAAVRAGELTLPASDAKPADLVAAALQSELEGRTDQRQALLEAALQRDPEYAPARWQSGFVRWDDQWLTPEQVAKQVAGDKTLAEYRRRRDAMVDTAEANRELARWCRKNRLTDEERVHWAKVLEFGPQDAEALTALGLQLYEGSLMSKDQIAAAKQQAGERLRAMKHWQPQMVKWREAIERGSDAERAKALEALKALDDPAVVPAFEATFAETGAGKAADAANLLLIETVGRMRVPEATQALLRRALVPDSPMVRAAACDELKKRPMFSYVPRLIAAMPGDVKTRFHISVLPNGMVLHEHEIFLEGREAEFSLNYESMMNPGDVLASLRATPRALAQEIRKAAAIEANVGRQRGQQEWIRDRVQFALQHATGFARADDADLWEKQYLEYYHWRGERPAKRVNTSTESHYQTAVTPPTHTSTEVTKVFNDPTIPPPPHTYCFPRGTLVVTQSGHKPIEEIRLGDRVLSQDLATAELSYQAVQERTLRVVPQLAKISFGDSRSIQATLGHPFWVDGYGWRIAAQLAPGDRLRCLNGFLNVESVEPAPPTEVYNLVVAGWHNYFAGEEALLVHDNSLLTESGILVPGLAESGSAQPEPVAARR